jgi:hypothetical protein
MVEKISGQEYEARARKLAKLEGKYIPNLDNGRPSKVFSIPEQRFYIINFPSYNELSPRMQIMYQGETVLESGNRGIMKCEDGHWKSLLTYNLKMAEEKEYERKRKETERFSGQINDSMRSYDPFGTAVRKSVGSA